jgi:hypothetical protein
VFDSEREEINMAEKTLAQMIRERMESERESCIDVEVKRQWDMVMEEIERQSSLGSHIAKYPRVSSYGYECDAWHIVCDKLKKNGFGVEIDRGTWISW